MKNKLKRLWWMGDDRMVHPLAHIFFYITLIFGLSFTFFADPTGSSSTFLYAQTAIYFDSMTTSVWGVAAIAITVANCLAHLTRNRWLGPAVAMSGFMLWFFAFFIYVLGGFWFGALVAPLPNMLFWVWQYVDVNRYLKARHDRC